MSNRWEDLENRAERLFAPEERLPMQDRELMCDDHPGLPVGHDDCRGEAAEWILTTRESFLDAARNLRIYERRRAPEYLPNCMRDECNVFMCDGHVRPDGFNAHSAHCPQCGSQWDIEWDFSDEGQAGWIATRRIESHRDESNA